MKGKYSTSVVVCFFYLFIFSFHCVIVMFHSWVDDRYSERTC